MFKIFANLKPAHEQGKGVDGSVLDPLLNVLVQVRLLVFWLMLISQSSCKIAYSFSCRMHE